MQATYDRERPASLRVCWEEEEVEELNWFSVAHKGPCHGEAEACLRAVRFDRAANVDCL
jgi:hypothetical protein